MSKSNKINPRDKVLLMGNPNVGKSVLFTEFTGIHAISSNFVGTTVTYTEGHLPIGNKEYTLIDVPGTYSLQSTSEAEAVAVSFMQSGAQAIICVLDATNLERNLVLALELQRYNIPTVYALNLTDVAERRGIKINEKLLAQELGAPVIPTVAVKRKGLDGIIGELDSLLSVTETTGSEEDECIACSKCSLCPGDTSKSTTGKPEDYPLKAKEISRRVSKKINSKPSFLDKLGDASVKPWPGIPIAFLAIALLVAVVVFGGRILRAVLLLPLVNNIIVPFFRDFFASFIPEGMLLNILTGEFGIFVISFEWIFALIFPYVLFFYIAFSFLEDSGYLPRISVLFDNVMRRLGVQGGSLIYAIMAFGCAVPAIIGSRAATSRKERLIITLAICFAIPCISQSAAVMALMAAYDWYMMPLMIAFGFFLFVAVSLIAGRFIKGRVDSLIIEVPNLLIPDARSYGRKLLIRMRHFLKDAEIPMMAAIVLAALLAETGALAVIARAAEPLVSQWLGMPREAVVALILGIVRREMSVAPLLALNLTPLQAFVGGAVSLMYIPCLSVFAILAKEFKIRIAVAVTLGTIFVALFLGGVINHVGQLFF
ncbi:MAG: ferrous iron transporter B [Coriobacteriia bacterium]|nr:ferrous iron transporter B [Coriobacteriia bacterium]